MLAFISSIWDGVNFTDEIGLPVTIALVCAMVFVAIGVNLVPRMVGKWQLEYKTRDLTYGAICLALGYALSWIKMFEMPLGGAVTLAALMPCFIYCYYFGFRKAAVFAAAYMLLQFTQPVFICHPLSALLDYIFPYFALCIVGLFRYRADKYAAFVKRGKEKPSLGYWVHTVGGHWRAIVGAALYIIIRYASTVVSGVACWDYWGYEAAPFIDRLAFSLGYNSFALVDGAIALFACVLLLSSRTFNAYMSASFAARRKPAAKAPSEKGEEDGDMN